MIKFVCFYKIYFLIIGFLRNRRNKGKGPRHIYIYFVLLPDDVGCFFVGCGTGTGCGTTTGARGTDVVGIALFELVPVLKYSYYII